MRSEAFAVGVAGSAWREKPETAFICIIASKCQYIYTLNRSRAPRATEQGTSDD
jgi:hypothetical protein